MGTSMDFFKREDSENYYYYCKYCGKTHPFPNMKVFKDDNPRIIDFAKSWYDRECDCGKRIGTDKILVKTKHPKKYYYQRAKEVNTFYKQYEIDSIPKPLCFYLQESLEEAVRNKVNCSCKITVDDVIRERIYKTENFNQVKKNWQFIRVAPYIFRWRWVISAVCVKCGRAKSTRVDNNEYSRDSLKFKKRGISMPDRHNYLKCQDCGVKWVDSWQDYDVELQKKQS